MEIHCRIKMWWQGGEEPYFGSKNTGYLRSWQQFPLKSHGKNSPKQKKGEKKGDNSEKGKGMKQMVSNVLIFIFN